MHFISIFHSCPAQAFLVMMHFISIFNSNKFKVFLLTIHFISIFHSYSIHFSRISSFHIYFV